LTFDVFAKGSKEELTLQASRTQPCSPDESHHRHWPERGRQFTKLVDDFLPRARIVKKMAGYHQFHAVRVAVAETLRAAELARMEGVAEGGSKRGGKPGDRRVGVVWHTQGSGKSLTMAFYAGRIIREPAMENPTVVVLTDRNDLDDQLFGIFARCKELLRQPLVQAADRADLRAKLSVAPGGVVVARAPTSRWTQPGSKEGRPRRSGRGQQLVDLMERCG
jgi:hypothetical protein